MQCEKLNFVNEYIYVMYSYAMNAVMDGTMSSMTCPTSGMHHGFQKPIWNSNILILCDNEIFLIQVVYGCKQSCKKDEYFGNPNVIEVRSVDVYFTADNFYNEVIFNLIQNPSTNSSEQLTITN